MTHEDGGLPDAYFEGLLQHREAMVELRSGQLKTLDKSILGISSGALGISIVFMDKIGGVGAAVSGFLLGSWLCFGAAISLNIVSYFTGGEDAQREIKKIDNCLLTSSAYKSGGNPFREATQALNIAALVLFLSGVLLLTTRAYTSTRADPNGNSTAAPSADPTYKKVVTSAAAWSRLHFIDGMNLRGSLVVAPAKTIVASTR